MCFRPPTVKVDKNECSSCGAENLIGVTVCAGCGAAIGSHVIAAASVPPKGSNLAAPGAPKVPGGVPKA